MVQNPTLEKQPEVYSSVREEYLALTGAAGLVERSHLGRLKVSGEDALDLLDRLSTNKLSDLQVGDVMGTVLTTNKGRIIDLLFVLRQDDHLLVTTGPDTRERVAEWIDFYTFIEDVQVEDLTETTAMISLFGPEVAAMLPQLSEMSAYESEAVDVAGIEATAVRTDFNCVDGFDLIVPAGAAAALWAALVDMRAVAVGSRALDIARIESCVPEYSKELVEDYNPLEAGLKEFISFNKGCYIGQEVVARLNTYDKVQRHLVRLSWSGDAALDTPTDLVHEGRKVGAVTSSAATLCGDRYIGLGYLRKAHAEKGTRLLTESDVEVEVEAIARPE